ncbi:MAG: hypothetical protein L0Y66_11705 [Myxococcaceae bacterium]|nr:hypothetical protein [Myxococcaceae bacterium]
MRRVLGAALACLALACASAPKTLRPTTGLGPTQMPPGQSATQLLAEARASFARRPLPEAVRRAETLFLATAHEEPHDVEGLYGAIQARLWRLEHGAEAAERDALVGSAVEAGQLCLTRAPERAECHYGLALALGVQARERHATAIAGLQEMVVHLRRAAELEPRFDHGGPARVLGLVLLRAPGWPLGPGDAEQGLEEARKAVALAPEYPPNLLVLSEALLANGAAAESRNWAERAVELARAQEARGEPDASGWVREGEQLLAKAQRSLNSAATSRGPWGPST